VRCFEGHAEEEASYLAGLSPASPEKTMARALQRMREELERGCKEMPARRRKLAWPIRLGTARVRIDGNCTGKAADRLDDQAAFAVT
jgi:hypothetical protein